MSKAIKAINTVIRTFGIVGSLFVRKTIEGKYEVAVAPAVVAMTLGSAFTCAVQHDEPFRQCVKSTLTMFQEAAHAN